MFWPLIDIVRNLTIIQLILEEIPYINVPLHTLLVVKSYGYDFEIETVPLKGKIKVINLFSISSRSIWLCCLINPKFHKVDEKSAWKASLKLTHSFLSSFFFVVECVDTYRIQPSNCSVERTTADALTTVPAHFDSDVLLRRWWGVRRRLLP